MSIVADRVSVAAVQPLQPMTFTWVIKRALLGLAILFVTMGSVAWLTYASIDPNLETSSAERADAPAMQATDARF